MTFSILDRSARSMLKSWGDEDLNLFQKTVFGTVNTFGVFRPWRPYVAEMTKEAHNS